MTGHAKRAMPAWDGGSPEAPLTPSPSSVGDPFGAPQSTYPAPWSASDYAPATSAPYQPHTTVQTPATQYQATQYPSTPYPAAQYPSTQYPATQTPSTQNPSTQYPAAAYQATPYQAAPYQPTASRAAQYQPTQYAPTDYYQASGYEPSRETTVSSPVPYPPVPSPAPYTPATDYAPYSGAHHGADQVEAYAADQYQPVEAYAADQYQTPEVYVGDHYQTAEPYVADQYQSTEAYAADHYQTAETYAAVASTPGAPVPYTPDPSVQFAPDTPVPIDSIWRDSTPADPDDDTYFDEEDDLADNAANDPQATVSRLFDSTETTGSHGLRSALIIVLCLALVGGLGFVGFTKGRDWINSHSAAAPDYPGPGADEVIVNIPSGAGASSMATILLQADVVASEKAFTDAVKSDPVTFEAIQAGKHLLKTQMSGEQALNALADPKNVQRDQVTVPEGFASDQTFARLSQITGIPETDFEAAAQDPSNLGLPDWATLTGDDPLEGFLFPETYAYNGQSTAVSVLQDMVTQFKKTIAGLDFENKAKDQNLTPYQALVLASIIQKEGADPAYAQDIAQVFINRLNKGMKLQSDATVIFANHAPGTTWTTDAQRSIDSPYNTYMVTGLPPGPICNPGSVALSAAVNPSTGNYLYFTAVNMDTGETKFATDAAGHDANVAELQAWCKSTGKCTG